MLKFKYKPVVPWDGRQIIQYLNENPVTEYRCTPFYVKGDGPYTRIERALDREHTPYEGYIYICDNFRYIKVKNATPFEILGPYWDDDEAEEEEEYDEEDMEADWEAGEEGGIYE